MCIKIAFYARIKTHIRKAIIDKAIAENLAT